MIVAIFKISLNAAPQSLVCCKPTFNAKGTNFRWHEDSGIEGWQHVVRMRFSFHFSYSLFKYVKEKVSA